MSPDLPQIDALPAFSDNYVWRFESTDGVWLVDPGDPAIVRRALDGPGTLAGILITHHHSDHIGGLSAVPDAARIRIIAPADDRIAKATERVGEGDRVQCGEFSFTVWELPGHTRSHVAFVADGFVFSGDTLFSLGCGRLFEGSPAQMSHSLSRLANLRGDTLIYATHEYTRANGRFALAVEPRNAALVDYLDWVKSQRDQEQPTLPTTIATELACNPFLRCSQSDVVRAAETRAGRQLSSHVDVFAILRQWKDVF